MKYPVKYTYLAFYLNSIADNGGFIELAVMKSKIKEKSVFKFLKKKFDKELDISLYTEKELGEFEDYFYNLYSIIDEDRKLGVTKNGICLLVAYCIEALQHNPENL